MDKIAEIDRQLSQKISELKNPSLQNLQDFLQDLKNQFLGKNGEISNLLKEMGTLSAEVRPQYGKLINELRIKAETINNEIRNQIDQIKLQASLNSSLDPTLPGISPKLGSLHPLNQVRDDIIDFFYGLGFEMAEGPEIETDWYNFEALNIPPHHPARDMQDTFYIDEKVVLRTQTSNVQIHVMENKKPPLRIIAPGHVYRADSDASHAPMFQQVEGLVVDKNISFAHLKGTLYLWAQHIFGPETKIRFRPSFFPFTEPSAEMDVTCSICKGKGCRLCGNSGWIEILGCGSVDPNVFNSVGIDPEVYTGFAFGFGIDRIAMIRYAIPEIGLLTRSEKPFLNQF